MPYVQFDEIECKSFVRDSKSRYENQETTNLEIIRWKFMGYENHPAFHLYFQDQDKELNIGRAVLNIRTLSIRGIQKRVTQVTDLLAVKSRANLVTFIELIKKYRSLSTDCVLHTSNENSEKIYSNFFKFKEIFELSAFAFPIRPHKIVIFFKRHQLIAGIVLLYSFLVHILMRCIKSINPIRLSDEAALNKLNILLNGFSNREISLLRSEEFLSWRYSKAPYPYQIYVVYSRTKPIGVLAARVTLFNGALFFLVMDYMSSAPIRRWEGFGLRLAIISEAIACNADGIFGLFNRKNKDSASFFRLPFIAVDDKMLPHRSPIFGSSFIPSLSPEELKSMYFSLGDLDYF